MSTPTPSDMKDHIDPATFHASEWPQGADPIVFSHHGLKTRCIWAGYCPCCLGIRQ